MLRLLPYVIVSLVLFLGSKLLDAFEYTDAHANIVLPAAVTDEQSNKKDNAEFLDKSNEVSLAAIDNNFSDVQKIVEDIAVSSETTDKSSTGEKADSAKDIVQSNDSTAVLNASQQKEICTRFTDFSPITLDILQELKQRREELESREQEFLLRLNALNVLKQELETKIVTLTKLKTNLESSLQQYANHEREKNAKLVKIYENMKPSDAAKIFDDMQTAVLLDVVEQMKETRIAPILASMDPEKAKELTIGLINRKKIAVN
ncbi:MotE family protein [Candidatus Lariskella endosymbiont of Epinotia ramella]|uniref:MotE family protein n=1 Tax=Candidatus Lariskella endosymbiont of Epinotia ramella TaxID=3066224 RepID=UPI0030CCF925